MVAYLESEKIVIFATTKNEKLCQKTENTYKY